MIDEKRFDLAKDNLLVANGVMREDAETRECVPPMVLGGTGGNGRGSALAGMKVSLPGGQAS